MRGKGQCTEEDIKKYNFHYAYDIMNEVIDYKRTCEKIVGEDKWCICKSYWIINVNKQIKTK